MGLIDVVGKKWAVCVLTLLGCNGAVRFGPIQRALPKVSPATLTSTLRSLEREELVQRTPIDEDRRASTAYRLTDRGMALYRCLVPLAKWLQRS